MTRRAHWDHYDECDMNVTTGSNVCTCDEVQEQRQMDAYDQEPSNMADLEDGIAGHPEW